MNLAFFTNNYRPFVGGVPIAIENMAKALRRRGHHVHIFAPDYGKSVHGETDVFRTWSIKNFNDSSFVFPVPLALDTYLTFNDVRADVVHVHHPFLLGMTGLHAARAEKLPVVFTYHTQYEQYAHYLPWDSSMVKELAVGVATRFANSCDGVIAPSSDIARQLEERGVDVPVRVIPTGVDLRRFRSGDRSWLRSHLNLPEGQQVMLFVSRLAKEKNVGHLVESFARVAERKGDVHLVLVGQGDEVDNLKKMARAHDLEKRVHFTGTLSGTDLISAYKSADLFVFASTTETQGMVVLEAMAGGCPVVAVDASGVRDVVVNGENGYLVPVNEPDAFAEASLKVLSDDLLQTRFRENALERARQLSLARTSRQVEELYEYVREHPHPDRNERFLLVKEFFRYQIKQIGEAFGAA